MDALEPAPASQAGSADDSYRAAYSGLGGMGVITLDVTDKTGKLVTLARVGGNEELMVLTEKGTVIRTRVEEVRVTGRNAQGVKVINIADRDSVIDAFPIRREDEL